MRIKRQQIINFLFIVTVFLVTRQFPFAFLSPIMNVAVVCLLLLSLAKEKIGNNEAYLLIILLMFPLTCNFLYSIGIVGNKVLLAVKFYIVLLSIGLAYFVKVDKFALKWFVILCLLQVLVMLAIAIYIMTFLNINSYLPLRVFFIEKGWGDIYTFNGYFYRIQIKGSALLVIAFILNLEIKLFSKRYIITFILLLGIVLAGNFAFLIALAIYFIYKIISLKTIRSLNGYFLKIITSLFFLSLFFPQIYRYISQTIEGKSDNSLSMRWDQVDVLLKSLTENNLVFLLGRGLGHTLDVITAIRDYRDGIYFEIQIIYIINQLGVIFFLCFIAYNIFIVILRWGRNSREVYIAYVVYIVYAVTNPYILDTNHVVVIIVLNSWIYFKKKVNDKQKSSINHSLI